MHTVYNIADWFLKNVENVTNKKLQKLVYYAYAWFLVFYNETSENITAKLCDARFEAWVHGAVCPKLYNKYKKYGSSKITKSKIKIVDFSEDELDVLEQVRDVYGKYNGNELESICHQEEPWKVARGELAAYEPSTNPIEDKDIFNYYSKRL